jgi:bacillolysin
MRATVTRTLFTVSLLAAPHGGCAVDPTDADDGASQAAAGRGGSFRPLAELTALATAERAALAQLGATDVALTADGRPGMLRFGADAPRGDAALTALATLYQVAPADLAVRSTSRDSLGRVVTRYQQRAHGLTVHGGELALVAATDGALAVAVSTLRPVAPAQATVDAVAASAAALASYPALRDRGVTAIGQAYVVDPSGTPRLCREVEVTGWRDGVPVRDRVFIDAVRAEVVAIHPQVHTAQDRRTYSAGGSQNLPGAIRLTENQSSSGDATIDAIHANVGKAYACAQALFGRDSFDDGGATLHASGHVGQGYVNAYWDGSQLAFGDGDGSLSGPLVSSDIVSHELAHAITEYTAGLVYQRESGALNEAMSDIFSAMCDIHDGGSVSATAWDIGEEVWTPGTPGDALRYMANPADDGASKDHTSVMTPCGAPGEGNDYCYVHTNSGLPNLMFKLLVTGGTHPRGGTGSISDDVQVPALGIERAQAIAYQAWTTYLTQTSDFAAARTAFRQAAEDLYPSEAGTIAATELAWYAVGVGAAIANLPTGVDDPNGGGGGGGGDDGSDDGGTDDGGTDDGGTDDGGGSNPADPDGVTHISGCNAGGGGAAPGVLAAMALLLFGARRRRRAARASLV